MLVKIHKSCSPAFTSALQIPWHFCKHNSHPLSTIHGATNGWPEAPSQIPNPGSSLILLKVWPTNREIIFGVFFLIFLYELYITISSLTEPVLNPLPSTTSVLRVHWGHVSYILFEIMKPTGKGGVVVSRMYFKTFCNSRPGAIGKDYVLQHWWSNHELARLGFHSTEPQMHLKHWLAFLLLFQICSASLLT